MVYITKAVCPENRQFENISLSRRTVHRVEEINCDLLIQATDIFVYFSPA
jgi:hypothetical protein